MVEHYIYDILIQVRILDNKSFLAAYAIINLLNIKCYKYIYLIQSTVYTYNLPIYLIVSEQNSFYIIIIYNI